MHSFAFGSKAAMAAPHPHNSCAAAAAAACDRYVEYISISSQRLGSIAELLRCAGLRSCVAYVTSWANHRNGQNTKPFGLHSSSVWILFSACVHIASFLSQALVIFTIRGGKVAIYSLNVLIRTCMLTYSPFILSCHPLIRQRVEECLDLAHA